MTISLATQQAGLHTSCQNRSYHQQFAKLISKENKSFKLRSNEQFTPLVAWQGVTPLIHLLHTYLVTEMQVASP